MSPVFADMPPDTIPTGLISPFKSYNPYAEKWAAEVTKVAKELPRSVAVLPELESKLNDGFKNPAKGVEAWLTAAEQFHKTPEGKRLPNLQTTPPLSFLHMLLRLIERHADLTRRKQRNFAGWHWDAFRGLIKRKKGLRTAAKRLERFGMALLMRSIPDELGEFKVITRAFSLNAVETEIVRAAVLGKSADGAHKNLLVSLTTRDFKPPRIEHELNPESQKKYRQFVAEAAARDLRCQHQRWLNVTSQEQTRDVMEWVDELGSKNLTAELNKRRPWVWDLHSFEQRKERRNKALAAVRKRRQRQKLSPKP